MMHTTIEKAKFKKLQRRLGLDLKSTVGLLELLWRATVLNAPAGDIGKLDNEMIAIECDYDGDPDLLISELVECGWLDACDDHRLVVHDWPQHCPNFIKGNIKKHDRTFAIATCSKHPAREQRGREHGATKPNLTQRNLTITPSSPPRGTLAGTDRSFDKFWQTVHRRVGKDAAKRAFARAVKRLSDERSIRCADAAAAITQAMAEFASSPAASPTDHAPIHVSTWLNEGRYLDDRSTWHESGRNGKLVSLEEF